MLNWHSYYGILYFLGRQEYTGNVCMFYKSSNNQKKHSKIQVFLGRILCIFVYWIAKLQCLYVCPGSKSSRGFNINAVLSNIAQKVGKAMQVAGDMWHITQIFG